MDAARAGQGGGRGRGVRAGRIGRWLLLLLGLLFLAASCGALAAPGDGRSGSGPALCAAERPAAGASRDLRPRVAPDLSSIEWPGSAAPLLAPPPGHRAPPQRVDRCLAGFESRIDRPPRPLPA